MTGGLNPFEALIAQLATEPGLSLLAEPGAGVLVWDQTGERLLWASPAAERLRNALTGEDGRTLPSLRARDRIKTLAGGLAPRHSVLKERLRLDPSRPWL